MIVDCCTFLNELDLLEARLEYLNNHVDYFIVVESNYTFNGNEKPYHIKANMDRFAKYGERFIYVPIEVSIAGYDFTDLEARNQWAMERQQRNAIAAPLDRFSDNDIVLFGSVDEIPNRNAIAEVVNAINSGTRTVTFEQDLFYFNLNQVNALKWPGTQAASVYQVRGFTPQLFRDNSATAPRVRDGGWHLSYWGSPYQIQYKIDNFTHQDVNLPHLNNIDNIVDAITNGKDLYRRDDQSWLTCDRSTLDPEMVEIFSKIEYKI